MTRPPISPAVNFAALWREVNERERRESDCARKLRLECNGAFVDLGAARLVGLRISASGVELIEFFCPRCNQRHESQRFR